LGFQNDLEAVDRGTPLAVIAVELNGFKNLNTRYIHEGGDMVLNEVGARLKIFVEEQVGLTAYHLSGDEFQLLATGLSLKEVRDLAAELKERLEVDPYAVLRERVTEPGEVTVTIAVSYRDSVGGSEDRSRLLQEADGLVEYGKFESVQPGGSPLPPVWTVEEAGDPFQTYQQRVAQSRRQRVRCEKCGRFGTSTRRPILPDVRIVPCSSSEPASPVHERPTSGMYTANGRSVALPGG